MAGSTHDFDFWIGDWDVFGPLGKQVGRNTITSMFANGMLHEHWHGNGGVEGRSVNAYDEARGCWHQTWVDSTGGVLLLDGGLQDGAMVLEGRAPAVTTRPWSTATDHLDPGVRRRGGRGPAGVGVLERRRRDVDGRVRRAVPEASTRWLRRDEVPSRNQPHRSGRLVS